MTGNYVFVRNRFKSNVSTHSAECTHTLSSRKAAERKACRHSSRVTLNNNSHLNRLSQSQKPVSEEIVKVVFLSRSRTFVVFPK